MPTANSNSWSQSNNYIDTNSLARTNPYAETVNVNKLYGVDTFQDRHSISFTWQASANGAQFRVTPATGATTATNYIIFRITDNSGNEVYQPNTAFAPSAATTVLVYNTSALNMNDEHWTVVYHTQNTSGATKVGFQFRVDTGAIRANSSATIAYTLS